MRKEFAHRNELSHVCKQLNNDGGIKKLEISFENQTVKVDGQTWEVYEEYARPKSITEHQFDFWPTNSSRFANGQIDIPKEVDANPFSIVQMVYSNLETRFTNQYRPHDLYFGGNPRAIGIQRVQTTDKPSYGTSVVENVNSTYIIRVPFKIQDQHQDQDQTNENLKNMMDMMDKIRTMCTTTHILCAYENNVESNGSPLRYYTILPRERVQNVMNSTRRWIEPNISKKQANSITEQRQFTYYSWNENENRWTTFAPTDPKTAP